uniref:Uncharacterized protein n=1 Tax=Amphimedon queenslandica TaxID=400682 RepID=A0A1X7T9P2_AMPQE
MFISFNSTLKLVKIHMYMCYYHQSNITIIMMYRCTCTCIYKCTIQ